MKKEMIRAASYDNSLYPIGKWSQDEKSWYDQWDGKWHSFKDFESKLRYVLKAYAFRKEHIDTIADAIPSARWSAADLWEMRQT